MSEYVHRNKLCRISMKFMSNIALLGLENIFI
jgi:hypothetical protein